MNCPTCGSSQPDNFTFCSTCGASLTPAEGQQPSAAPAVAPEGVPQQAPVQQEAPPVPAQPQPPAAMPEAPRQGMDPAPMQPQAAPADAAAPMAGQPAYGQQPGAPAPYPPAAPYGAPPPAQPAPQGGGYMPPPAAPAYAAYPQAGAPQPGGKKKKGKAVIAIILAAVLLIGIVAAVLLIFVIDLRNPKQQVRDGLQNTIETLQAEQRQTRETLGLQAVMQQLGDGPYYADLALQMELDDNYYDIDSLTLTAEINADMAARRMDIDYGVGISGSTMLQLGMSVDDSLVAISAPDLFRGSLGVDTETLAQDFNNSVFAQLGYPLDEDLSINIFDSVPQDEGERPTAPAPATQEAVWAKDDALWEKVTVEKLGKADTKVNGVAKSCDSFSLTIPADVFIKYLEKALYALYEDDFYNMAMLETALLQAQGISGSFEDGIDQLIYQLERSLDDDIELVVYIANKQLVKLEATIDDGDETELTIEIGGETNLSDSFTLTAETDDSEMSLEVTGLQVPQNGVYSRNLAVFASDSYGDETSANLELSYDMNASYDNLMLWGSLENWDGTYEVEVLGTLTVDAARGTLYMDLDDITFVDDWGDAYYMSLQVSFEAGGAHSFARVDPDRMLFDLDEYDLIELMEEISGNAGALGELANLL